MRLRFQILAAAAGRRPRSGARSLLRRLGRGITHAAAPKVPTVILFAIVGGSVGPLIIYVDWPFPDEAREFTSTGQYAFWLFLHSFQTALWAVVVIPLSASIRELWGYRRGNGWEIVGASALVTVLVVGFFVVASLWEGPQYPLPHHSLKLLAVRLLGSVVALVGVVGILLVHAALESAFERSEPKMEDVAEFLRLREHLQRLLAIEGAILGAAVLGFGALHNAVLAYGEKVPDPPSFPREHVLLFGAYFSALLALFYAPTYSRLLAVGRKFRDAWFPIESPRSNSWAAWYAERKVLDELLQLQVTTSSSFRTGVAILTPLASSVVGLLLD